MAVNDALYRRLRDAGFSHRASMVLSDPNDTSFAGGSLVTPPDLTGLGGGGGGLQPVTDDDLLAHYEVIRFTAVDPQSSLVFTATGLQANTGTISVAGGVATVEKSGLYNVMLKLQATNLSSVGTLALELEAGAYAVYPQVKFDIGKTYAIGASFGPTMADDLNMYPLALTAGNQVSLIQAGAGCNGDSVIVDVSLFPMML